MDRRSLGQMLQKRREALKLTQTDISFKFGYNSAQFISNIERGLADIPFKKIEKLAIILEMDPKRLARLTMNAKYNRLSEERV